MTKQIDMYKCPFMEMYTSYETCLNKCDFNARQNCKTYEIMKMKLN